METPLQIRYSSFSFSSYPTYEEWKHIFIIILTRRIYSSYPTYEEWKPNKILYIVCSRMLQFLSYLWGMETKYILPAKKIINTRSYPTYEEWKRFYLVKFQTAKIEFLSYLWGMETKKSLDTRLVWIQFLSYLWGMETKYQFLLVLPYILRFLSYLWGMETSYLFYNFIKDLKFLSYLWGMETEVPG